MITLSVISHNFLKSLTNLTDFITTHCSQTDGWIFCNSAFGPNYNIEIGET